MVGWIFDERIESVKTKFDGWVRGGRIGDRFSPAFFLHEMDRIIQVKIIKKFLKEMIMLKRFLTLLPETK